MFDSDNTQQVARRFNVRAASYDKNKWHVKNACRLVELAPLKVGDFVLDAATGTGMAAIAAAKVVGAEGRVLGVDISSEMLKVASQNLEISSLHNIDFMRADATRLSSIRSASVDHVLCAAGLLYMPVARALSEWRRLLRTGGTLTFSTMMVGSPPAARLFRECASRLGLSLTDPSESLGSSEKSILALEAARLEVITIKCEQIDFGPSDFEVAWESNVRSAGHENVQLLSNERKMELHDMYVEALSTIRRDSPQSIEQADVLYVVARK